MANKVLNLLAMSSISLVLFTALSFATIGRFHPGPLWLWTSWLVSLGLTVFILRYTEDARRAWGYSSLAGGVLSLALILVITFIPVSASAPYEPGAEWLQGVDFTPPIVARLREALASAYFGVALLVLAAILFSSGYLLLHAHAPRRPGMR